MMEISFELLASDPSGLFHGEVLRNGSEFIKPAERIPSMNLGTSRCLLSKLSSSASDGVALLDSLLRTSQAAY